MVRAAKSARTALRSGDREKIKALLPELVSAVEVDWSKRKDPVVSFSYHRNLEPMEVQEGVPARQEFVDRLNAAVAHLTGDDFIKAMASEAAAPSRGHGARVRITHRRAPLTFVARWDLANIERMAADAVERFGKSLQQEA